PIEVPGILEATAFFAQAALEQGVSAIVNMSQISARRIAKSHAAQNHWIAERLLDRSGIPVTHLRPTLIHAWQNSTTLPRRRYCARASSLPIFLRNAVSTALSSGRATERPRFSLSGQHSGLRGQVWQSSALA